MGGVIIIIEQIYKYHGDDHDTRGLKRKILFLFTLWPGNRGLQKLLLCSNCLTYEVISGVVKWELIM